METIYPHAERSRPSLAESYGCESGAIAGYNKDVEKEGVEKKCIDSYIRQMPCETEEYIRLAYIIAFQDIWDSIIKKKDLLLYGWNANPWVWVIEFEQCKKTEEI